MTKIVSLSVIVHDIVLGIFCVKSHAQLSLKIKNIINLFIQFLDNGIIIMNCLFEINQSN